MDVSIIIVNYNTISLLLNAIYSIFSKTEGIEYEVIVIDNHSSDNSKTILDENFGNKVVYFPLEENIGFGRANNEAIKIAKGRNLFFLNPDTLLLNNAVKILSDFLDNNERAGCCGGNLTDVDGNPVLSFGRFYVPSVFDAINQLFTLIPEKIFFGKNSFYNFNDKPIKVKYITGADLMIRKQLFESLHGYDPDFFMYYEETELEYRAIKAGYDVYCVPNSRITHLEGKSLSNNNDKYRKYSISQKIFIQKLYGTKTLCCICIILYLILFSRISVFSIFKKEKLKYWLDIYKSFSMRSKTNIFNSVCSFYSAFQINYTDR